MTTKTDAPFGRAVPGSLPNQRKCMTNQAVVTAAASIELANASRAVRF